MNVYTKSEVVASHLLVSYNGLSVFVPKTVAQKHKLWPEGNLNGKMMANVRRDMGLSPWFDPVKWGEA